MSRIPNFGTRTLRRQIEYPNLTASIDLYPFDFPSLVINHARYICVRRDIFTPPVAFLRVFEEMIYYSDLVETFSFSPDSMIQIL